MKRQKLFIFSTTGILKNHLIVEKSYLYISASILSQTTYSPEELLAMMLDYAKEIASDFAGLFNSLSYLFYLNLYISIFISFIEQPIDAAVITVPAYFTQAERKALLRSADLIKLKVLQLINSNTAGKIIFLI
jgi:molecular chaperone DnaK (HSP70)